ncbi:MAG: acyl-CoA thioesterase [Cytophagales bacterium]|nr:acyl-CoA thioesterase [Bernardetiaceae bacterium]MDW8204638.1 acyl-CoA thioesterase [Cytophagales bacterium]
MNQPLIESSAIQKRMANAETRIFKAVFPNLTNHYDTLFGGTAMSLMDEVAFIAATRFTRKKVVTVCSDKIDFNKPIPAGTIVELVARIVHVGRTSLRVSVEVFTEQMYSEGREQAIVGQFTFVALDHNRQPTSVL